MKSLVSLRRRLSTTQTHHTFQSLGVPEFWCARLAAMGVYTPTHTQASSLPHLYTTTSSLILRAETGSGKTLAYLLPLLELLRLRIEAHDPATQLLPVGLIVAPSVELVSQVCSVARGLYPEHANMVHLCHGERGATRRQNAGLLVATPHAVSEAINPVHLTALRTVVLDEADALLSGAFAAPIRSGLLVQMKQLMPENRPAHVFCAATMPDKGKDSAFTFLTRYYPDALTVTTQGSHRALPQVYQCFLQVDAGLPLSPGERQVLERQVQAAEALGREEGLLLAPPAPSLGEGGQGEQGQVEEVEEVVAAGEEGGSEGGLPLPSSTPFPPSPPSAKGRVDTIARAIATRKGEDEHLALQVEEAAHAKKLWVLTQAAVFDALLLPARVLGLLEGGQGYQLSESGREVVQALTPGQPTNPLLAPPTATLTLEGFREGPAPSVKRARAAKLSSSRATRAFIGVEDCSGLPMGGFGRRTEGEGEEVKGGDGRKGKGLITPYHPPLDKTPPALTRDLAALVPPTLLFVNSASQAATLTKWLNERCGGHFGVAELSASLPVETRGRRLDEFAGGSIRALVCTNVAARGLDLRNVAHVIQAQFATDTVAYLHRCGRTGRAGARGMVTSLVTRAGMPLALAIVEGEEGGETLENAMSAKKSFAKARKRVALVETALKMAEGQQQQQQQQQGTA